MGRDGWAATAGRDAEGEAAEARRQGRGVGGRMPEAAGEGGGGEGGRLVGDRWTLLVVRDEGGGRGR